MKVKEYNGLIEKLVEKKVVIKKMFWSQDKYYSNNLSWSNITNLFFVTKELILENPELPWDLKSLCLYKNGVGLL